MAVVGKSVSVADTPTRLDSTSSGAADPTLGSSILVRNRGGASVFLGAGDVTTALGFELLPDESLPVDLGRGESLYGVCASGTVTCHVLEVGV